MLRLFSLHTIREIFDTEAHCPVSPMAQLCYMRCLIHYFADLEPSADNTVAFTLRFAQMKNPRANRKYFEELQFAGLVTLTDKTVEFLPVWNRHIERHRLERPDPMAVPGMDRKPAAEYKQSLISNKSFKDLMGMRYKYPPERVDVAVERLVDEFIVEQTAKDTHYLSEREALSHCISWIGKKLPAPSREDAKSAGTPLLGW